ncbi:MAG: LysR substrate-binding domain-containing protein [Aeromonas sp.]
MKYAVTLLEMKLFLQAIQLANFSDVARRQDMSPSSVSRKIAQLEEKVGSQLLHRHTRAISPTAEGLAFASYCGQLLEQYERLVDQIEQRADTPRGRIKISAPVAFGRLHIAPYLSELLQRYPLLQVELDQTDHFVDPAAEGVDLLIRIGVMQDSTLRLKTLGPQHYVLAASPAYVARYGEPQDPAALLTHNCLVFRGRHGLQRWFIRQGEALPAALDVSGNLSSNNAETLVAAAVAGAGVVLFPTWLIGEELRTGRLLRVLTHCTASTSLEPQQISALYLDTAQLATKVRVVIDFFAQKYNAPQYWDALVS